MSLPQVLICDRDRKWSHEVRRRLRDAGIRVVRIPERAPNAKWMANRRILEIDEVKTVPHVPLSHPFVERLLGTMRREFLEQVPFWNGRGLERKLAEFRVYYNAVRSHASLDGRTPLTFVGEHTVAAADLNHVRWMSHCRGLVQLPSAA